jgi:hypothetical protein
MNQIQSKLMRLMITGILSGTLLSQAAHAADTGNKDSKSEKPPKRPTLMDLAAATDGNITHELMSEDDLLLQLNDDGTKLYNSLSPEGKQLAIRTASRSCNGQNECKGLGACASDKNQCAGKNECKGQTKCAFSDKNVAVKLAAKKMAEKRLEAQQK